MKTVRIALIGCGTVGQSLLSLIASSRDRLAERGVRLEVTAILVRDRTKARSLPPCFDSSLFMTDSAKVLDAESDIVVEVMGGTELACEIARGALRRGKHFITANKALISRFGVELHHLASEQGVTVSYEAAVGAGIPVIRALRENLCHDEIDFVMAIPNGTTNFILTRMARDGMEFEQALDEARRRGFAEADPSLDIDGYDSSEKLALLAMHAFRTEPVLDKVRRIPLRGLDRKEIEYALKFGYSVKYIAVARRVSPENTVLPGDSSERKMRTGLILNVYPAMLPSRYMLAGVSEEMNAFYVKTASAGPFLLYGRGAGGGSTALGVFSDLVETALEVVSGRVECRSRAEIMTSSYEYPDPDLQLSRHYLRLIAVDRPLVLAEICNCLGRAGISIRTLLQTGIDESSAEIVMLTHPATIAAMTAARRELEKMEVVRSVASVMRVEGDGE